MNIQTLQELEDRAFTPLQNGIRNTLADFLAAMQQDPGLLSSESPWIPPVNEELSQASYELFLTDFLYGMADTAAQKKEFADTFVANPLPFEEAIAFAKNRLSLTKADYYSLSDTIRAKAWTVGRLSQIDAVNRVKQYYIKQLAATEMSMEAFVAAIKADDMLAAAGWADGSPRYYELVFRTNAMTDYNSGRAYQFSKDQPVALEFIGIEDSRQTSICAKRSGIILPYTDPWWDTNWPPLHFQCRSTVRGIYREEAEALGMDIKQLAKDSKELVAAAGPTPNTGFGINPIRDNQLWQLSPAQQSRITRSMIQEELNGVIGQTICKDFSKAIPGYTSVATTKGGVRYPDALTSDEEFTRNLAASTLLAESKGYYVELRKAENLKDNLQFDAWVNGMEKWEFKHISSVKITTISRDLKKAVEQAQHIVLEFDSHLQVPKIVSAISSRYQAASEQGRLISKMVFVYSGDLVEIAGKDLKDQELLQGMLTELVERSKM